MSIESMPNKNSESEPEKNSGDIVAMMEKRNTKAARKMWEEMSEEERDALRQDVGEERYKRIKKDLKQDAERGSIYDPEHMADPEIEKLAGEVFEETNKLPDTEKNRGIFLRLFKTTSDEELSNVRHDIGEKEDNKYEFVGGIADLVKRVKRGEVFNDRN